MPDKRIKGMWNRITQEYRVPTGNLLHSHDGAVVLVHVLAVGLFLGKLLIGELTEGVLAGDNKALIRYLENRFVEIARSCKRYMVLTKNTYRNTVMKESQVAVMEEFVDNVKILINALGYKVLDPLLQIGTDVTSADDEELFINTGSTFCYRHGDF